MAGSYDAFESEDEYAGYLDAEHAYFEAQAAHDAEEAERLRWECQFPGKCLMPGDHLASECHTVEMMQEMEAERAKKPD